MTKVTLKPGQTLEIVETKDRIKGLVTQVRSFEVTHEDLLKFMKRFGKKEKETRLSSEGVRFSREVGLLTRGIFTGKWSTGASIDRSEMANRLIDRFLKLDPVEYKNLTGNARANFKRLQKCEEIGGELRTRFRDMVKTLDETA